jgi:hypothetical protein
VIQLFCGYCDASERISCTGAYLKDGSWAAQQRYADSSPSVCILSYPSKMSEIGHAFYAASEAGPSSMLRATDAATLSAGSCARHCQRVPSRVLAEPLPQADELVVEGRTAELGV